MKKFLFSFLFFYSFSVLSMPTAIIFIGPPGSGKSTQAQILKNENNFCHISTGDILRKNIENKTETGNYIQNFVNKGLLVPDSIILNMLYEEVMNNINYPGVIIDGSSRTILQADFIYTSFHNDFKIIAIFFDINSETLIYRLSNRSICNKCNITYNTKLLPINENYICKRCNSTLTKRQDDTSEVILNRFAIYNNELNNLKTFYNKKDNVYFIDASKTIEEVNLSIKRILNIISQ